MQTVAALIVKPTWVQKDHLVIKFYHTCIYEIAKNDARQNCVNGIVTFASEDVKHGRTNVSLMQA